jgi:hypothetical protein
MKPAAEWNVIEGEPATIPGLFTGYACILAAIGPVAVIVQHLVFIRWTLPLIVIGAVVGYILSLIGVYVVGFIIDALAPSFDAQKNPVQAMKVAVYSYTASWVAGILNIVPILGILAIIAAFYGLYIFWLGLPPLMKVPQEKAAGYAIVTVIVAIVINVVVAMIGVAIIGAFTAGAILTGASAFH